MNNFQAIQKKINDLEKSRFDKVHAFIKKKIIKSENVQQDLLIAFWQSKIPAVHYSEIAEQYYFGQLLFSYFSSNDHVNSDFLSFVMDSNQSDLCLTIIKISRAFLRERHWESMAFLRKKRVYKNTFYELEFIRTFRKDWDKRSKAYWEKVEKLSTEDIIIQGLCYYEYFKRYSTKTLNNRSQQIAYETHFVSVLNEILSEKRQANDNEQDALDDFRAKIKSERPPQRPLETFYDLNYRPKENISPEKQTVREIFDFFIQKEIQFYQIDHYLCGLSSFDYLDMDDLEAELNTEQEYAEYRQTLEKGMYSENYFLNQLSNDTSFVERIENTEDRWTRQFEISVEKGLLYLSSIGLPKTLKLNWLNHPVDLRKVMELLYSFANLMAPQGRMGIDEGTEIKAFKRSVQEKFAHQFDPDYMVAHDRTDLLERIVNYLSWSIEEADTVLSFLTLELNSTRNFTVDLFSRPFVQSGDKIIWLSSFLRDRRWEIILEKRLNLEKIKNHDKTQRSEYLEKTVADLFRQMGFGALSSYNYEGGEIDTLAFKENTLFVIELKSTHTEENLIQTKRYQLEKIEGLVHYQLERNAEFVKENFNKIRREKALQMPTEIKWTDLNIERLTITTGHDAVNRIQKKDEPLRLALFELIVFANNNIQSVFNSRLSGLLIGKDLSLSLNQGIGFYDRALQDTQQKFQKAKSQTDLWSGKEMPSVEDLISAIKANKIWKAQRLAFLGNVENVNLITWNGESIV